MPFKFQLHTMVIVFVWRAHRQSFRPDTVSSCLLTYLLPRGVTFIHPFIFIYKVVWRTAATWHAWKGLSKCRRRSMRLSSPLPLTSITCRMHSRVYSLSSSLCIPWSCCCCCCNVVVVLTYQSALKTVLDTNDNLDNIESSGFNPLPGYAGNSHA